MKKRSSFSSSFVKKKSLNNEVRYRKGSYEENKISEENEEVQREQEEEERERRKEKASYILSGAFESEEWLEAEKKKEAMEGIQQEQIRFVKKEREIVELRRSKKKRFSRQNAQPTLQLGGMRAQQEEVASLQMVRRGGSMWSGAVLDEAREPARGQEDVPEDHVLRRAGSAAAGVLRAPRGARPGHRRPPDRPR